MSFRPMPAKIPDPFSWGVEHPFLPDTAQNQDGFLALSGLPGNRSSGGFLAQILFLSWLVCSRCAVRPRDSPLFLQKVNSFRSLNAGVGERE